MASVTWSPHSLNDLEIIVRDLAVESPRAAADLAESMIATSDLLSEYPYLGRLLLYTNRADVRVMMIRNHRLIYRVQEGDVEISRIIHAARRIRPFDLPF